MAYMSVTADQMSSAAGYLTSNWGDYGYRLRCPDTYLRRDLFRVALGRRRFSVLTDKWGNAATWTRTAATKD